jgi:membrane associated rhomboid family serine protease
MFIPIGDNIQRRTFPVVSVALIIANALVYAVQFRTFHDAYHSDSRTAAVSSGSQGVRAIRTAQWGESADPGEWSEYADDDYWQTGFESDRDFRARRAAYEAEFKFIKTWGLVPAELARGQVIGLLTHMFLHGDIFHLLGNMVTLWAFACALEAAFGRATFLGFYLLFGIAGGLAHFASSLSSEIPLVGASGAIAGLIGGYTVLYGPLSRIKLLFFFMYRAFTFEVPAAAFGFVWFMLQLFNAGVDSGTGGGVAWFCHIGGFLAGVAVAFVCRNDTERELTADKHGNLILAERRTVTDEAVSQGKPQYVVPAACPYCRQELSGGHQMAANLIRCGNPECQRMVYLEQTPPPAAAHVAMRR